MINNFPMSALVISHLPAPYQSECGSPDAPITPRSVSPPLSVDSSDMEGAHRPPTPDSSDLEGAHLP